jgi:hypothetical protein
MSNSDTNKYKSMEENPNLTDPERWREYSKNSINKINIFIKPNTQLPKNTKDDEDDLYSGGRKRRTKTRRKRRTKTRRTRRTRTKTRRTTRTRRKRRTTFGKRKKY